MHIMHAGLSLLTDADHAQAACGEMMDILQNFILWRAKIHFQSKHLSMRLFAGFLSKYCKDKETSLKNDCLVISEELFYTLPSIQASQIYVSHEHVACISCAQTMLLQLRNCASTVSWHTCI